MTGGLAAKLYLDPNKSTPLPLTSTPSGYLIDWLVGTHPPPSTLYLEALSPGQIDLDLELHPKGWEPYPGGTPIDYDSVVFTAFATELDLDIGSSQTYEMIWEEFEFTQGAFTVWNHNDSDGDGTIDLSDTSVSNTIEGKVWEEVDLMPLVIHRPPNYDPAKRLTLIHDGWNGFYKTRSSFKTIPPRRQKPRFPGFPSLPNGF